VLFVPVLLGRGSAPPHGPDSESDGGWGQGSATATWVLAECSARRDPAC
jgi:hypothetical protein